MLANTRLWQCHCGNCVIRIYSNSRNLLDFFIYPVSVKLDTGGYGENRRQKTQRSNSKEIIVPDLRKTGDTCQRRFASENGPCQVEKNNWPFKESWSSVMGGPLWGDFLLPWITLVSFAVLTWEQEKSNLNFVCWSHEPISVY